MVFLYNDFVYTFVKCVVSIVIFFFLNVVHQNSWQPKKDTLALVARKKQENMTTVVKGILFYHEIANVLNGTV